MVSTKILHIFCYGDFATTHLSSPSSAEPLCTQGQRWLEAQGEASSPPSHPLIRCDAEDHMSRWSGPVLGISLGYPVTSTLHSTQGGDKTLFLFCLRGDGSSARLGILPQITKRESDRSGIRTQFSQTPEPIFFLLLFLVSHLDPATSPADF